MAITFHNYNHILISEFFGKAITRQESPLRLYDITLIDDQKVGMMLQPSHTIQIGDLLANLVALKTMEAVQELSSIPPRVSHKFLLFQF